MIEMVEPQGVIPGLSKNEVRTLLPPAPSAPLPIRWLGRIIDWTIIGIGGAMIVLVFFNVMLHIFSKDLAWVTELGEFLMVWVSFLGGAAAAQRGGHMAICEFVDKLSLPHRRWADAAIQSICLVALGMLTYFGWSMVQGNWENELTVLGWPMAFQYMGMAIGSTAMMIFVGFDIWQILRGVPREQRYGKESD
jgi:TRAP-type C4-dicarboxylate transport system permease small subunit